MAAAAGGVIAAGDSSLRTLSSGHSSMMMAHHTSLVLWVEYSAKEQPCRMYSTSFQNAAGRLKVMAAAWAVDDGAPGLLPKALLPLCKAEDGV